MKSKRKNNSEFNNHNNSEQPNQSLLDSIFSTVPNMPSGIKQIYKEIQDSEKKIKNLENQIGEVKIKLKPLSRIDINRGKRKEIARSEINILKALKKRLEKLKFQETDNWSKKMNEYKQLITDDVSKVRNEIVLVKARSYRYVSRNKPLIIRKTQNLLDNVNNNEVLQKLKISLNTKESKDVMKGVKDFLEKYDTSNFLYTVFVTHEIAQAGYKDLLRTLLATWNPKAKGFEFTKVQCVFVLPQIGS